MTRAAVLDAVGVGAGKFLMLRTDGDDGGGVLARIINAGGADFIGSTTIAKSGVYATAIDATAGQIAVAGFTENPASTGWLARLGKLGNTHWQTEVPWSSPVRLHAVLTLDGGHIAAAGSSVTRKAR